MPKPGKDIAWKIVNLLREKGGETEIGLIGAGKWFDCHPGTVSHILGRLIECKVIKRTAEPDLTGTKRAARYALDERFKEGDNWREALKRKSSRSAPTEAPDEACHGEECLRARKVLLEELLGTFERLKVLQEENQTLGSAVDRLQKEVGDLRSEAEKKGNVCHQLRSDVNQLESRLRALRIQTSQPPTTARAVVKELKFDGSGAVILSGEGLPDRS